MTAADIAALRADLVALHATLVRYGLVVWTGGNVSARVPDEDRFLIKPSGIDYDDLSADDMILCDLDGNVVDGEHAPSSDTAAHAYVYRNMPAVGGVVHTHSPYATAWAARGEAIPCVITGMADEFGGDIPVGPFAIIGDDSIGRGIVATLDGHRSRAVLMQNHGVFTIGRERPRRRQGRRDVRRRRPHRAPRPPARRAHRHPAGEHRCSLRSVPERLRTEPAGEKLRAVTRSIVPDLAEYTVWFLTGSQGLYGEETLRQVAEQSKEVARGLQESSDIPVTIVWKPVLTDSDSIRRAVLEANADDSVIGLVAWMHTFSPAKMWIAGLDALQKPLLHLHTQANVELPWADIDFDFMNLNQAAHGDREFGYIESRLGIPRTTVVGHVSDPAVTARVGTWTRAASGRAATRRMRLARFGDNMRYVAVTEGDKTEAELRFGVQVNTWGVNELADAVQAAKDADVDSLVAEYLETYDVVPELRADGERHESLRDGARIELGLRGFLEEGGFSAFTTSFEDLGTLTQLPGLAVQRLMADGYGFGAEGDWKTAVLVQDGRRHGLRPSRWREPHGGLHLSPGAGQGAHPGRPHARGQPEPDDREAEPRDPPARHRRQGRPGAPGVHRGRRTRRGRRAERHARPVPPRRERRRERGTARPASQAPRRPGGLEARARLPHLGRGVAHRRRGPSHGDDHAARRRGLPDFAAMSGVELLVIDDDTTLAGFEREVRWNAAYYRLARGL